MRDFSGRIAVVTGGGTGIGRALAVALAAEGCSLALCDIREDDMGATTELALAGAPQGVRITTFKADVSSEEQIDAFRDQVSADHGLDHIHLLFNNAGVSGGGSFVTSPREQWDRVFRVCWGGVYYGCRAFLPMLMKSDAGHIVNVSSVNGFWASLGPDRPHTAYSAAKFAVKGFSEALINDLKMHAPHIKVSVVMPGHIGTRIAAHSISEFSDVAPPAELAGLGDMFEATGLPPAEAARIILEGVREDRWRILVGPDAVRLGAAVRVDPEGVYDWSMADLVARMSG
jgi:NAD(P)-dependent dehydrogenase (short-subunit alcohol dehydrogenase family)